MIAEVEIIGMELQAQNVKDLQQPLYARKRNGWILLRSFRGSVALPPPWFQIYGLQSFERINLYCLSHSTCGFSMAVLGHSYSKQRVTSASLRAVGEGEQNLNYRWTVKTQRWWELRQPAEVAPGACREEVADSFSLLSHLVGQGEGFLDGCRSSSHSGIQLGPDCLIPGLYHSVIDCIFQKWPQQ